MQMQGKWNKVHSRHRELFVLESGTIYHTKRDGVAVKDSERWRFQWISFVSAERLHTQGGRISNRLFFKFQTRNGKGGALLSRSMQLLWWVLCTGKICFYHVYSNVYFILFWFVPAGCSLCGVWVRVDVFSVWVARRLQRSWKEKCFLMHTALDVVLSDWFWKLPYKFLRGFSSNQSVKVTWRTVTSIEWNAPEMETWLEWRI